MNLNDDLHGNAKNQQKSEVNECAFLRLQPEQKTGLCRNHIFSICALNRNTRQDTVIEK